MSSEAENADINEPTNEPYVWYKDGLRFECQQCGECCKTRGVVWVNSWEMAQMARYMGLGYTEFRKTYIREVGGRLSIGETKKGECLMLDLETGRCKIYPARPNQCSSYPFWSRFLASRSTWTRRHARCPGMNRGCLWTYEEIQKRLRRD